MKRQLWRSTENNVGCHTRITKCQIVFFHRCPASIHWNISRWPCGVFLLWTRKLWCKGIGACRCIPCLSVCLMKLCTCILKLSILSLRLLSAKNKHECRDTSLVQGPPCVFSQSTNCTVSYSDRELSFLAVLSRMVSDRTLPPFLYPTYCHTPPQHSSPLSLKAHCCLATSS